MIKKTIYVNKITQATKKKTHLHLNIKLVCK